MAAIHDLLAQVQDEALRARLEQEINRLSKTKKFGLVFEEHLPECTPLYDIPVKRGSTVAKKTGAVSEMYEVSAIKDGIATCYHKVTAQMEEIPVDELVSVAQFGEPIYPYLKPIDSVCNAPDSDLWHTLIEADNYHALQLLEYLYAGKVDCIYIDPPYNTGAKDWKYNNDYVDSVDSYRHSKWLSMMKKRLKLAKNLLNPNDSIMVITIDEKEYIHLGCLLEELFPEARIQMVSSVINPHGANRKDMFARVEEYIYFVFFGSAHVWQGQNDMLNPPEKTKRDTWARLLRGGGSGLRSSTPNQFYPVYFRESDGKYMGIGDVVPPEIKAADVKAPEGCFAFLPMGSDGKERCWGLTPSSFLDKVSKGYIKFGPYKEGSKYRALYHLQSGTIKAVENGEIEVFGKNEDGTLIVGSLEKPKRPVSMWVQPSHDSRVHGAMLLNKMFPEIRFQYPKSLYAVRDTLRICTADKPNALIVDFFAGSGTTLQAVNLLNAEDDGNRRCIMVTNNEVSEKEANSLIQQGFVPGDDEWEKLGIARYVTWPRTVCSIKGNDVNGKALEGEYYDSDLSMSEGFAANAEFFKLGFLDKTSVALGRQLKELFPILWLKAGAHGPSPKFENDQAYIQIFPINKFAVLIDEKYFQEFDEQVRNNPEIQTIYIVTDSEAGYREMISGYRDKDTYQLYRDYLDNFRINTGR